MSILSTFKTGLALTGVHDPLRRLLSPQFRRNDDLAGRLVSKMRGAGFGAIEQKFRNARSSSSKYVRAHEHMREAVEHASRLNLLGCSSLRVLDLGCGSGYFLWVLKAHGHDAVGVDLDDDPIYNETIGCLGITRHVHRIQRHIPLPDIGTFDLITAHSICFDLHGTDEAWSVDDWRYFVADCRTHLRRGGRLHLNFNPATSETFRFIPDDVAAHFRSLPGASLTASKEFLTVSMD